MTENNNEDLYQCVGVCMADPDSGYCLGCGRPPLDEPTIVAEPVLPGPEAGAPSTNDPDTPE